MNKALYILELKRNLKSFLIWGSVVLFITVFILLLFLSFADMGESMQVMMEGMPEGMVKGFGMNVDIYTNVLAYYSTYFGLHIMILTGIFAITMGANILSKEEREKTSEFLLTRPISRTEVINSKLAAYFTLLSILIVLQTLSGYLTIDYVSEAPFDNGIFITLSIYGTLLTLLHGALGWALSLIPKRGKAITGPLIGVVVGGFVCSAISKISEDSEFLRWISPFSYVSFDVSLPNYSLDPVTVIVFLAIIAALHILVYVSYNRRDLDG